MLKGTKFRRIVSIVLAEPSSHFVVYGLDAGGTLWGLDRGDGGWVVIIDPPLD